MVVVRRGWVWHYTVTEQGHTASSLLYVIDTLQKCCQIHIFGSWYYHASTRNAHMATLVELMYQSLNSAFRRLLGDTSVY